MCHHTPKASVFQYLYSKNEMFQLHTQMHAKRTIPQHLNVLRELSEKDTSSQITILLHYAWCAPQYVNKIYNATEISNHLST